VRRGPPSQEWLEAAAIFSAISGRPENLGKDWWNWTEELRDRDEAALAAVAQEQKAEIDEYCVLQFLFDSQVRGVLSSNHGGLHRSGVTAARFRTTLGLGRSFRRERSVL
jgi:hypothetical protein